MKKVAIVAAAVTLFATVSSAALAQDQAGAQPPSRQTKHDQAVLKISEITIVGRVQKPIAAVDVAKIQPKLTLAELRQPFLDRIEEATRKDPF
ncbi:MAG TPA: hypothetical protein VE987_14520 [Polyangiaceae bacterium]|nr:hypothetical protein [Polyangiaceae bacterium]